MSAATTIPGPPSISPIPETAQLRRAITGRPRLRAWAISARVPHSPPTAIVASPEATIARFRAWPIPVATTWVQYGLAAAGSSPGRIPIAAPAGLGRAARGRFHHARPAAADDGDAGLGEQPPHLLGEPAQLRSSASRRLEPITAT